MPVEISVECLCIWIYQELAWVAAVSVGWVPRAVHAVCIALAWHNAWDVAVPDVGIDFFEWDASLFAFLTDEAKFYLFCDVRKECKVGASAVIGSAQPELVSWPDLVIADSSCMIHTLYLSGWGGVRSKFRQRCCGFVNAFFPTRMSLYSN